MEVYDRADGGEGAVVAVERAAGGARGALPAVREGGDDSLDPAPGRPDEGRAAHVGVHGVSGDGGASGAGVAPPPVWLGLVRRDLPGTRGDEKRRGAAARGLRWSWTKTNAWCLLVLGRSRGTPTARIMLALVVVVAATPSPAHAYVDFGVGSYAFQILIAWGLALAFLLRTFWGRIVTFLRRLLRR